MSEPRGACPTLFTPMQTGDGLLARIVPAERVTPAAFAAFARAAARHGSGAVEISARGSVQVRGLSPESAPHFASEIAALGVATEGVPVIADPLAGEAWAPFDAAAVAAAIRGAIGRSGISLAPKVSVILDAGTHLHLDGLSADLRLSAGGHDRVALALAGDAVTASPLGSIAVQNVVNVVVEVLRIVARYGRASEALRHEGLAAFAAIPGIVPDRLASPGRPPPEMLGLHQLAGDRFAVGIAPAFGHARAAALAALAEIAAERGAHALRPAPARALLAVGLDHAAAMAFTTEAERLGFIVRADDMRRRIVACPGRPACASGLIEARRIAADIARAGKIPGSGVTVHVSGCRKGCAHPGPAALTLVGTERGCAIVHQGSARGRPNAYGDPDRIAADAERLVSLEPV
jgi:precorrin-3B synthase